MASMIGGGSICTSECPHSVGLPPACMETDRYIPGFLQMLINLLSKNEVSIALSLYKIMSLHYCILVMCKS